MEDFVVRKAAFASFRLDKDVTYRLEVNKTDKTLTVSIAGHTFGRFDDALPDTFYVGSTAMRNGPFATATGVGPREATSLGRGDPNTTSPNRSACAARDIFRTWR